MEPINRDDGRHWCNPGSEDPSESPAACPDCGAVWVFNGESWALSEPSDSDGG